MPNTDRAQVLFDGSPLRYLHTGLGQFSFHLLKEYAQQPAAEFDISAVVHPHFESLVPPGLSIVKASWLRRHGPPWLQRLLYGRCNVWHMTTENTRLRGIPGSAQIILTIHGLHFLDEEKASDASLALLNVQRLVDQAHVITAVSRYTAKLAADKLNLRGRKVEVIYNGISFSEEPAARPPWAPAGRFIFSVGTFFSRKNLHVLLPMMQHLPGLSLILAGNADHAYGDQMRSEISRLGLQSRVIMPGEIPETVKTWLYEQGDALVFPSVSEGFGIPLIEAFYYGKPAFCGRYASLPEVGGPHALFWDDFEPVNMAQRILEGLRSEMPSMQDARKEYARQFSWNKTAQAYLALYKRSLHRE